MKRERKQATTIVATTVLLGLLAATPHPAMAQDVQWRPVSSSTSKGMSAIDAAAQNDKYLFIFFWKNDDQQTRTMYGVFKSAMGKMAEQADSIAVRITDANEKRVVDKYQVARAPMPLVVALAPNGAVTKGLPFKFDESQLREAFVSPCTAKILKGVQDRKLVFLCIQNGTTKSNAAAMQGVTDFKADARYAAATEIVTVDPADAAEAELIEGFEIDPQTDEAVTVFLAPPGRAIGKVKGPTNKDRFIATLSTASTGCGPGGCGPNGCGPKR